jgi:hypothetical protein
VTESNPNALRLRLQQLLAVPDRQRTEAEWDELNELEIMLASGNREGAPEQGHRRPGPGGPPRHSKPGGGSHDKRQVKNFHRRPPKGNPR